MSPAQDNQIWARTFFDELARCGVDTVCLAPGSRSTPLVLAAAGHPRIRVVTHLDERSAAFFALGVGKATRRPCAVITTSGTAAANLFPAVVEASQARVPLLALTADRPHRLRGADANQAIDQLRLFGPYVRSFVDLAPPSSEGPALRHLRALASRAVADASGANAGPVHLNFPFAKPLEPMGARAAEPDWETAARPAARAYTRSWSGTAAPESVLDEVATLVRSCERGVIVAGPTPEPWATGPAVRALAAATGFPLLADPLGGARYGPTSGATVVGSYDLALRDSGLRSVLAPDLVIRIGGAPTSASCCAWLADAGSVPQVVVADGDRWMDHLAVASTYVRANPTDFCSRLAARVERRDLPWRRRWEQLELAARAVARLESAGGISEADAAARCVEATPEDGWLFVSNSMPVRDVDAFAPGARRALRVLGNRGASGIDGIVSTALGIAAASGQAVVALLGDLALAHDMNGLLATREPGVTVVFVVINNDGGGIFHMLPIRDFEPEFTRHFATPHGLDFRRTSVLYDLPYQIVDAGEDLSRAIREGCAGDGCRIVEVRTDREEGRSYREHAARRVTDAVRQALSEEDVE
jgi:2-succinyl-5-enolpyruvyl-6-hydroxy-3-cyclohexene-1-carboxylate synthase